MLPTFLVSLLISYMTLPLFQVPITVKWALIGVGALVMLNCILWWINSRLIIGELKKNSQLSIPRASKQIKSLKLSIIVFTFVSINYFQWPEVVSLLIPDNFFMPVLPDLVVLFPPIIMILTGMAWERKLTNCSFNQRSFSADRPEPGFFSYLSLRVRTELGIILLPWFLLTLVSDTANHFFHTPFISEISVTIIVALCLVLFGPLMLRILWNTVPLPQGPLKRRLQALSGRLRFKHSGLFLWKTHMQIPNAAVIGMTSLLRYVFLTDALLANCRHGELEAIFAHEAGHIKLHHFGYYFLMIIGFVSSITLFSGIWTNAGIHFRAESFFDSNSFTFFLLLYTIFFWGYLFGYVSRRLEQEADLFGINHCHNPEDFISALNKLGMLSGRPRSSSGWRHYSIEKRIIFLKSAIRNNSVVGKTKNHIIKLKLAIISLTIITVLLLFLTLTLTT